MSVYDVLDFSIQMCALIEAAGLTLRSAYRLRTVARVPLSVGWPMADAASVDAGAPVCIQTNTCIVLLRLVTRHSPTKLNTIPHSNCEEQPARLLHSRASPWSTFQQLPIAPLRIGDP